MTDNWYNIIVGRKSDMAAARDFLKQFPYRRYDLQALANERPIVQNLVKRFLAGCIFIYMPEETIPSLINNAPVRLQLKKKEHTYTTYSEEDVENLVLFLKEFEGTFTLVKSIPENCEQRELGNLGHPQRLQGYLCKTTGSTNHFYVQLSDKVILMFRVSKKQEIIKERRMVPQEDVAHVRWYVLRTRQEEELQKQIQEWRMRHLAEIENKMIEDCITYIPYRTRINALGNQIKIPVYRGLLFVRTTLNNLQDLQQEQIPELENSLMKVKSVLLENPKVSKYVIIDEQAMRTFRLVNDHYSNLADYESFDFKDVETVRLIRPDHPFDRLSGILQHKRKKLYMTFGFPNLPGKFHIPAIEVLPGETEKVLPADQADDHS